MLRESDIAGETGKPDQTNEWRIFPLPIWVSRIPVSIGSKMLAAFVGIAVILLALGVAGLQTLNKVNTRTDQILEQQHLISFYRTIYLNTNELVILITRAINYKNTGITSFPGQPLSEITALSDTVSQMVPDRVYLGRELDEINKAHIDDFEMTKSSLVQFDSLMETARRISAHLRKDEITEANQLYTNEVYQLSQKIYRYTYTLTTGAESRMAELARLSKQDYESSTHSLLIASVCALLFAMLLGFIMSQSLVTPIRKVQMRLNEVAGGKLAGEIRIPNRDEIGDLAENVNQMSRKLERLYHELETANRHKSQFLANMSHELRTPMNAIIGFNRIVMRRCKDILPEKHYENLGKIGVSADQLLGLINTILDLSKIEAGRMQVHPVKFDLDPLLQTCIRVIEPLTDRSRVAIEQDISPAIPTLFSDQDKLRQIIMNLLGNAAKFTEKGSIKVEAKAAEGDLEICIADTGIGIPADKLASIFEEFTQVDGSSTRHQGGTGLGLTISQRLAELLGGRIEVASKPDAGSTFKLIIPVRHASGDRPNPRNP